MRRYEIQTYLYTMRIMKDYPTNQGHYILLRDITPRLGVRLVLDNMRTFMISVSSKQYVQQGKDNAKEL